MIRGSRTLQLAYGAGVAAVLTEHEILAVGGQSGCVSSSPISAPEVLKLNRSVSELKAIQTKTYGVILAYKPGDATRSDAVKAWHRVLGRITRVYEEEAVESLFRAVHNAASAGTGGIARCGRCWCRRGGDRAGRACDVGRRRTGLQSSRINDLRKSEAARILAFLISIVSYNAYEIIDAHTV
ncbi:hypothetical protein NM688_g9003 [Phlebia brevispora]|uniref:Uncharacterized protein n=1 Tax=Phlebia brevispora TaxID=194682 RepID=A0ACC1RLY3_9APHY|nr:hypothetical protein NM688_g9003 [Phlebia brevispora]